MRKKFLFLILIISAAFFASLVYAQENETVPASIKEQVKCVFTNSNVEQKCYTGNNNSLGCSGLESCVADVAGISGNKLSWKSSCGGYSSTMMDGQNEYATFDCTTDRSVTIISPNGGEIISNGSSLTVSWKVSSGMLGKSYKNIVNLFSTTNGVKDYRVNKPICQFTRILDSNPNQCTDSEFWQVSGIISGNYIIEVLVMDDVNNQSVTDTSDAPFTITASSNQPKVCTACVGGTDTGETDVSGCTVYLCPTLVCSMPICEVGSNSYETGKIESNGCKNYACSSKTCSAPACKDGTKQYDTGKVDDNNCKVYECVGQTSAVISEKVKCWFKGSQAEQQCYAAVDDKSLTCFGKESCIMDVTRPEGEKITWKSSCGGYAYTTMDGTGGYDGRGEYAEFDCAKVTTTPEVKESKVEIIEMKYIAKDMVDNKYDSILFELNQLRNTIKEQQNEIKYLKSMANDLKNISDKMKSAINDFITYGVDTNTVKLGAGERAAVINSYKAAFAKLPETEAELTDAIKIANGRFPTVTSDKAETTAKEQFIKIYKRVPDLNNSKDNAAIKVMAYGLRQKAENRNLNSEKAGIKIFNAIYGHTPSTTEEWNTMQAITYSGASR